MKRVLGFLAALTLLVTAAVVTTGSAGAQATATPVVPLIQDIDLTTGPTKGFAQVYVVHGLNLDGQSAQTDGGTAVTVCAGPDQLLTDFQFGEITPPLALEWDAVVPIAVYVGADVPCGSATPVISQDVTVPAVDAVSLVATAGPDAAPSLLPVVLDVSTPDQCNPVDEPVVGEPNGVSTPQGAEEPASRLGAVHAAAAGQVAVSVDGTTAGEPVFGESLFAGLPPDTYSVEVTLGGTPIVGPADIDVPDCTLTVVYVVGNQPIAPPEPVEPTTTTTQAPAAAAVTAAPAFTG